MKNIKEIIIAIAVLFIVYLVYDKFTAKPEFVEVPVRIEVPIPCKDGKIIRDTILVPKYVEVTNPVNDTLLKKYQEAKDSIAQLELYRDAITTRIYNEKFEDDVLSINVETKVQGKMLDQDITNYYVKPSRIIVDTTLTVKVPQKINILGGAELGMPLPSMELHTGNPIVKFHLGVQNKKGNILTIGIDTQRNGYVGYTMKLFSL
jgi:hypothetical protein